MKQDEMPLTQAGEQRALVRSAAKRFGRRQWTALSATLSSLVAVKARSKLRLPPAMTTACAFAAPVSIASGFRRSRVRDMAVWLAQMWAYKNAFELPNDDDERLRRRAHIDYPIVLDSWVGGGRPPTQRLQTRLRLHGQLTVLDKLLSFLYWTWELEPHLAIAWIRWERADAFAAAAGRLAATFDLTLLGYWTVPSAPPWWASEKAGRMDGEVRRVVSEVGRWLKRQPNPTQGDSEIGANPLAAMPSDHFASASMTAMLLYEQDRRLGVLAWAYAIALGSVLVYLGEHYLTDLVAGLALALVIFRAKRPLERLAESVLKLDPERCGMCGLKDDEAGARVPPVGSITPPAIRARRPSDRGMNN